MRGARAADVARRGRQTADGLTDPGDEQRTRGGVGDLLSFGDSDARFVEGAGVDGADGSAGESRRQALFVTDGPIDLVGRVAMVNGGRVIATQVGHVGEAVERRADARLTVHSTHDREHLGEGVAGRFGAGALHVDDAAEVTVLGEHEVVAAAPGERETEIQRVLGVAQAAGVDAVVAGVRVELGAQGIGERGVVGVLQEQPAGVVEVAVHQPRTLHAEQQLGGPAGHRRLDRRVESPAHVGELVLEHGRTGRVLVGLRGDCQAPLEQSAARRVQFAGQFELLGCEMAQRVEHAEPTDAVHVGERHHRGVDQSSQRRGHRAAIELLVGAHRLGDVQRPATGEHREPTGEHTVVVIEEVVAPLQRRPQRLMVGDGGRPADGEEVEPVADALGDLADSERAGEAGSELDRQRQAVHSPADGGHRDVVAVGAEAAPRTEQLDRGVESKGLEADHLLAVDPQRDATGDQHRELRTRAQEGLDGDGDGAAQLLAVVQQQHHGPSVQPRRNAAQRVALAQ